MGVARAMGSERERPSFGLVAIPARMTSTPAGCQRSPGLSSSSTELLGRVRKYSPSSTCVPSDSSSSRTGSPGGTFSFSLPATHTHTHRIHQCHLLLIRARTHSNTQSQSQHTLRSLQNFVRLANRQQCVRASELVRVR